MTKKALVPLQLPGNPTNPLEAAPKQYVDTIAAKGIPLNTTWDDFALGVGPSGGSGTPGTILLSGTTAPVAGTGAVGNYYINTTTGIIYGPKTAGNTWPVALSTDQDSGWQAISYYGGWQDWNPADQSTGAYRKIGNTVYLRGLIKCTSAGGSSGGNWITSLPGGYRPPQIHLFGVLTSGGALRLDIRTDGLVTFEYSYIGNGGWLALNQVFFQVN